MSKSLNARCIRRWQVEFKDRCDSKFSTVWRKRDLRGYIRESGLVTAFCMVEQMAENNAKVDFLNEEATTEEIDEEIQNELEAWND